MKKVLIVTLLILAALFTVSAATGDWTKDPVSLKIWYSIGSTSGEFFKNKVQSFLAQYPNITAEVTYTGSYADSQTKISASRMAGNEPDMIVVASSQLYTGEDENRQLQTDIQDEDFNYSDILPGVLDYGKFNGELYALPFSISTQVIYYNKTLVKKAGYDLEANPPKTWEEFVAIVKAVVKKNRGISGFDTTDVAWLFKSMLLQNNNSVVKIVGSKAVPTFAEASGIEVGEFWQSMIDDGVMKGGQHANSEKTFLAGKVAFFAGSSNRTSEYAKNSKFEIGAIEMPCFKKQAVFLGGSTTAILTTDKTKHDACWALTKYLLNTENQSAYSLTGGYLPIRKSGLELASVKEQQQKNNLYKVATAQLEYASAYTQFPEMGTMDQLLKYMIEDIEYGAKVSETMKEYAVELESEIASSSY